MESTNIEPRRAPWRMISLGSTCWAPFGEHGWRASTVIGLGKNRGYRTVVHLAFETGGKGRRVAGEFGASQSSRARTSRRQCRSRHELSPDLRLVEQ